MSRLLGRRWSILKKSLKNNRAFTLFEGLLALVILSVLGFVIISGVIQVNNLISKTHKSAAYTAGILIMDNYLRQVTEKISFPFWINNVQIEENIDSLKIPYLYGEKENKLLIYREGDFLYVESELTDPYEDNEKNYELNNVFGPFDMIDISLEENDAGMYVSLTINDNSKEPVIINTGFSSFLFKNNNHDSE